MINGKHSKNVKIITLILAALFFINTIAWAYPDRLCLAAQSIFKPLTSRHERDINILECYIRFLQGAVTSENKPDFIQYISEQIGKNNVDIKIDDKTNVSLGLGEQDDELRKVLGLESNEYLIPCRVRKTKYYAYITLDKTGDISDLTVLWDKELEFAIKRNFIAHAKRRAPVKKMIEQKEKERIEQRIAEEINKLPLPRKPAKTAMLRDIPGFSFIYNKIEEKYGEKKGYIINALGIAPILESLFTLPALMNNDLEPYITGISMALFTGLHFGFKKDEDIDMGKTVLGPLLLTLITFVAALSGAGPLFVIGVNIVSHLLINLFAVLTEEDYYYVSMLGWPARKNQVGFLEKAWGKYEKTKNQNSKKKFFGNICLAIRALGFISEGSEGREEAVSYLIKKNQDLGSLRRADSIDNIMLKAVIYETMGRMEDEKFAPILKESLKDAVSRLEEMAEGALVRAESKKEASPEEIKKIAVLRLTAMHAAEALAWIKPESLCDFLGCRVDEIRWIAMSSLAEKHDEKALSCLLETLFLNGRFNGRERKGFRHDSVAFFYPLKDSGKRASVDNPYVCENYIEAAIGLIRNHFGEIVLENDPFVIIESHAREASQMDAKTIEKIPDCAVKPCLKPGNLGWIYGALRELDIDIMDETGQTRPAWWVFVLHALNLAHDKKTIKAVLDFLPQALSDVIGEKDERCYLEIEIALKDLEKSLSEVLAEENEKYQNMQDMLEEIVKLSRSIATGDILSNKFLTTKDIIETNIQDINSKYLNERGKALDNILNAARSREYLYKNYVPAYILPELSCRLAEVLRDEGETEENLKKACVIIRILRLKAPEIEEALMVAACFFSYPQLLDQIFMALATLVDDNSPKEVINTFGAMVSEIESSGERPALFVEPTTNEVRELTEAEEEAIHAALRKIIPDFEDNNVFLGDREARELMGESFCTALKGTERPLRIYVIEDKDLRDRVPDYLAYGLITHSGTHEGTMNNLFIPRSKYLALLSFIRDDNKYSKQIVQSWRNHEVVHLICNHALKADETLEECFREIIKRAVAIQKKPLTESVERAMHKSSKPPTLERSASRNPFSGGDMLTKTFAINTIKTNAEEAAYGFKKALLDFAASPQADKKMLLALDQNISTPGSQTHIFSLIRKICSIKDDEEWQRILNNLVIINGRGKSLVDEVLEYTDEKGNDGIKVDKSDVVMVMGSAYKDSCAGLIKAEAVITFVNESNLNLGIMGYCPYIETVFFTLARALCIKGFEGYEEKDIRSFFEMLNAEIDNGQSVLGKVVNITFKRPVAEFNHDDLDNIYNAIETIFESA